MKKILLVVLFAAALLAAWFYNSSIISIAALPVILFIQSIIVADNLYKTWGKATPDTARAKAGKTAKVSVWSYIVSTAILPYLWVAVFSLIGFFPLTTIIIFLSLPVAIGCSRSLFFLLDGSTGILSDIGDRTINLSLIFTALLAISFIIGKFI